MIKTIKVIRLAPGESVLIVAAPGPTRPCNNAAACPYAKKECPCSMDQHPKENMVALLHVA